MVIAIVKLINGIGFIFESLSHYGVKVGLNVYTKWPEVLTKAKTIVLSTSCKV